MLVIQDSQAPCSRRTLLTAAGCGLGGLLWPQLDGGLLEAADGNHVTGKSVIYLFQQGGPSQLETFDPKPEAPGGNRTVTGVISTRLPGVHFGERLPQLAAVADKLTVVRSFQTGNGGHNLQPIVGRDSYDANIGVHYSRVVGTTRQRTGVPTNAVIYPASVAEGVPGPQARGNLRATGPYSSAYAPFAPGADGQLQKDLKLSISRQRLFGDRQTLLKALDKLRRSVDVEGRVAALDELQRQAYEVLLGGAVTRALDLSQEDPRTVELYDTGRFERPGRWNSVSRGRKGYYDANTSCIGKLLLLARRLCEAGCGFVTIHAGYAGVWDMHGDGNNLNMADGMRAIAPAFDHAVAALVKDLEARGLSDRILLVCNGEMGRTPRINKRGGRDHWSRLAPLLLTGGGLPGGRVIGRSDRQGGQPADRPLTPRHLFSTIMHTLFDTGQLRLTPSVPEPVQRLIAHPPLPVA